MNDYRSINQYLNNQITHICERAILYVAHSYMLLPLFVISGGRGVNFTFLSSGYKSDVLLIELDVLINTGVVVYL